MGPWLRSTQTLFVVMTAIGVVTMTPAPRADDVTIEHLGIELAGKLQSVGVQGSPTVLIVHDALSFHGAEGPQALQSGLAARGVASLSITLSLGHNRRRRLFDCTFEQDHRDADAVQEVAAWTDWLVGRGINAIVLAGEGVGALQIAMPPEAPNPAVRGLVLIAPAPSDEAAIATDYHLRFGISLADVLAEAQRVGSESGDDTIMNVPGFMTCARARVTAGAFLDAYNRTGRPSLTSLLRERALPTMIFLRPDDTRKPSFKVPAQPSTARPMFEINELSTGGRLSDLVASLHISEKIADFLLRHSR